MMSSTGGLTQRRRGGADGADNAVSPFPLGVGAVDTDHRIAYDPNEIIMSNDEKTIRLTLMEEILLLGLKDKQGYLSFWNDSLSYVLRGCILIELALRNRIQMVQSAQRKRLSLPERPVEAIKKKGALTGEVLLDETCRLIKQTQEGYVLNSLTSVGTTISTTVNGGGVISHTNPSGNNGGGDSGGLLSRVGTSLSSSQSPSTGPQQGENWSVVTWIDLLSGETWNILRISYQLRQVRERLAKGLVDKGVLRTERRNFILFDMATHPVADPAIKEEIIQRVLQVLTTPLSSAAWGTSITLRTVCLCIAAYAGNVLENVLTRVPMDNRESCWRRAEDLVKEFSKWDDGIVGSDTSFTVHGIQSNEVVAAVCSVFSKMDVLF